MADTTLRVIFEGVDKTLSSTAGGIGNAFGKTGRAIAGGLALGLTAVTGLAAGSVALGSKLISLGSDAEETASLLETSLGGAVGGFNDQLRDFATEANRSFFELQEGTSTIVAMTKAMGAGEQQAADMGVEFGMMASDLGSFFNRADSDVLLDLQSALGGSSETLQKYGIIVNETTLKQMALNQGLIDSSSEVLPPLMRATLIQQAIQEQASDAMGDAIRTSDSWSNSLKGLKARLSDTATEMGIKLIPIMTPLLNLVGDLAERAVPFLTGAFEKLLPLLELGSEFIGNLAAGIQSGMTPLNAFNFAWGTLGRHLGLSADTIQRVREGLAKAIEQIIIIKDAIIEFLDPIRQWIDDNIELKDALIGLGVILGGVVLSAIVSVVVALAPIALTIGAVILAVALLREAWERDFLGIRTAITEWADEHGGIMQGIKAWWEDLKVTWRQLGVIIIVGAMKIITWWDNLKETWSQLGVIIGFGVDIIKAWWEDLKITWSLVGQIITLTIDALELRWTGFKDKIGELVTDIKNVWGGLQTKFESVKAGITSALQPIIDLIGNIKDALGDISLPDWMNPGSPTPWETGLLGVGKAMQQLSRQHIPALTTSLQGAAGSSNSSTVTNNNLIWNIQTSQFNAEREMAAALAFVGGI